MEFFCESNERFQKFIVAWKARTIVNARGRICAFGAKYMFDIFYFISYSVSNLSRDDVQCACVLRQKNAEPLCIWIWYAKCEMKFKTFPTFSRHCCSSSILSLKGEKRKISGRVLYDFHYVSNWTHNSRTKYDGGYKKKKNEIYVRNFSYYFKFTTGDEWMYFFPFFRVVSFFRQYFEHSSKIAFALYDTKGPAR